MPAPQEIETPINPKVQRIARHLEAVDETLVSQAEKLATTPYKDLSSPEALRATGEVLAPQDLVAVHLTDTFPENGVIRPKAAFEPDTLRFTRHDTINALAEPINITRHNWETRRFAILIPFHRMAGRVVQFHPNDTFVLDEQELPLGTVITKNHSDKGVTGHPGKAKIVELDYSIPGTRLNGFHRAVYQQMIDMGYFPQRAASYGWDGWGGDLSNSNSVIREFCNKYNIPLGTGRHESHWTGELEDLAYAVDYWKEIGDSKAFLRGVDQAGRFLAMGEIPNKYKQALVELFRKNQSNFQVQVNLPDFEIDDPQTEKARSKIVDLTKPTGYFIHQPSFESIPIVTREGIISHRFARSGMGVDLGPVGNIQRRNELFGYDGLDYLSVNNTQERSVIDVINDSETAYKNVVMILISPKLRETGKVGGVPAYHRAEVMVKRRISPSFFDGIIANESFLNIPAKDIAKHILLEGMDVDWDRRRVTTLDTTGFTRHRFIEKYRDDLDKSLVEELKDSQAGLLDAYKAYAVFGGYNEAEDITKVDKNGVPNYFRYINGSVLPSAVWVTNVGYWMDEKDVRKKPTFALGVDTSESLEKLRKTINDIEIPYINEYPKLHGLFRNRNSPVSLGQKEMTKEQLLELAEKIYEGRKAVMKADQKVWDAYVESVSGKPLEEATSEDFLIGLSKKMGVPLYDTTGKVIWPE